MGSLLTDPLPPEVQTAMRGKAERVEQARVLAFQCFLPGYVDGDIGFEEMCRAAVRVMAPLEDQTRNAWLGQMVQQALLSPPAKRRSPRGLPYTLRDVIREVTEAVAEQEGFAKTKNGPLWSRVAEIFTGFGVEQSATQIYRVYYPD